MDKNRSLPYITSIYFVNFASLIASAYDLPMIKEPTQPKNAIHGNKRKNYRLIYYIKLRKLLAILNIKQFKIRQFK